MKFKLRRKVTGIVTLLAFLSGVFIPTGLSAQNHETATSVRTVTQPDSLSERELLAKALIEAVQTILNTGPAVSNSENSILPVIPSTPNNPDNPATSIIQSSPALPIPLTPPDINTGLGNPRPYLGPDTLTLTNGKDTTNNPGSLFFPFLSPDNDLQNSSDGNYVWVPDSLAEAVKSLLAGKGTIANVQSTGNPADQKVIFRGDTIPMVIRDRKFGRFDRKLYNYLAYPKGIWGAALTASYGELSTENLELLSLLSDVTVKGHIFSIKPAIYYFVRNNLAIGLRLTYTEGKAGIDSFKVDIDDDMNFSLSGICYRTEQYQAGVTLTRYYGLSPRSRIHLTNEMELAFASGNSDFRRPYGGVPKETHATTMKVALTYSPGVSVQVMKNVSFDLSFGAFGLHIKSEKVSVDGVKEGTRTTSGADFRFNIFNINFGIGVHL